MYSYGPPHMAGQKQDDQLEHTFSSYERIRDVALKTYQSRWTIGRSGERGTGISVLAARHDDDDGSAYMFVYVCGYTTHTHTHTHTYIYIYIYMCVCVCVCVCVIRELFKKFWASAEHFCCGNTLPLINLENQIQIWISISLKGRSTQRVAINLKSKCSVELFEPPLYK